MTRKRKAKTEGKVTYPEMLKSRPGHRSLALIRLLRIRVPVSSTFLWSDPMDDPAVATKATDSDWTSEVRHEAITYFNC